MFLFHQATICKQILAKRHIDALPLLVPSPVLTHRFHRQHKRGRCQDDQPVHQRGQRMGKRHLAILLTAVLVSMPGFRASGEAPLPDGTWLVSDRVAIEVFDCRHFFCGRVVWLRRPALRTPEICGRTIIWGLTPAGAAEWTNGMFYDPEDGDTYNLIARLRPDGTISARIYEGVALFGKTETLRRIPPRSLAGWC